MRKLALLALAVCMILSTVSSADVLREIWDGSRDINAAVALANSGTPADQVDILADPTWADIADNYSARMTGWLTVPETGEYTFYLSGDDYQKLWISQDDNPANAELAAYVDGWTASQDWGKYESQKAAPMQLEAGQVLAFVGIMQEGGGGDGQDWGWIAPGSEDITVIPGVNFVAEHEVTAPTKAGNPSPANGATGIIDGVLSWDLPADAETGDLLFGTDPAALEVIGEGIVETSIDMGSAGAELATDTTYYWRVDVGGAPGFLWSFTTEPETFQIQGIIATSDAATGDAVGGPQQTVDGSGLDADGGHNTESLDMWLGVPAAGEPVSIQYEFPRVYKVVDMKVWNSNSGFEGFLGYGFKDVTVEYSVDGENWTVLADVEFAQAPAAEGYMANTTVDFGGVGAKYVKLTANTNWGGLFPDAGLSEVQFSYVPAQARLTAPADGATGVDPATVLDWYAGRGAVSSDVTVNGEMVTVEGSSLAADLVYGLPYTWMVDENDGTDVWAGDVWTFTTAEFVSVASDTLVYDEAGNTLEVAMDGADLTAYAPDTLRVSYTGKPVGYAEADGVVTMGASGHDIWDDNDDFRYAYKTLTGDAEMVARVDSIDNVTNNWAKAGIMIRQSTDTAALHNTIAITGDYTSPGSAGNGAAWQGRIEAGTSNNENQTVADPLAPPYWVKIVRVGDDFTGFISPDGVEWTQLGDTRTTVMEDPVLIGLALTSHDSASTVVATFSEISMTGDIGEDLTVEVVGDEAMPSNDAADLYVAVEDGAGAVATAAVGDAAATQHASLQNWNIPLADLAGVDLTNVAKITVGAGTPDAPAAGSGTVDVTISVGTPLSHNVMADVTSPADLVVGVPNDGLMDGDNFGWPAAEYPALAVDNDVATKFLHFKGELEPTGIQVAPAVGATVVTGLTLTTANDAVERDPISFELYGSNESIDGPYELIAAGDVVDFAGADAWPRFTMNETPIEFENEVAYTYYQILFPAVRDPGSANSMQIAEIELIGVSSY